jgi:hypothetical protein
MEITELQHKYISKRAWLNYRLIPNYAHIKIKAANTSIAAKCTETQAQRMHIKMKYNFYT